MRGSKSVVRIILALLIAILCLLRKNAVGSREPSFRLTTIWVPHPAGQFLEDGVLKCVCPECGHIKVMSGFDEVIAYVCNECGTGVDVLPLEQSGG